MTSKFGSKKKIIASTNNVTELPLAVYAHHICAPQDNNFSFAGSLIVVDGVLTKRYIKGSH
jgi:hypothetical protein